MYVVLLASHLSHPNRHLVIQWALQSVANGVSKPDRVLISYSGQKAAEDTWRTILTGIDTVILHNAVKQCQFQHYKNLRDHVSVDDIVMFLDDDDLYHEAKVQRTREIMSSPYISIFQHTWSEFDPYLTELQTSTPLEAKKQYHVSTTNEHWTLAIRGSLFKKFFSDMDVIEGYNIDDLILEYNGTTDLLFSAYMRDQGNIAYLSECLYYHRHSWAPKEYVHGSRPECRDSEVEFS